MRVLVIEDEVSVSTALRRGLQGEGFTVDIEADGAQGLWRAQEGEYDIILLDIMLPSMNGYLVCRTLREAGDWTPILMLTAKAGEYDEAEGLETGADDYLTKPFSFVVLLARIRALLRRGTVGAAQDYVAGDLRLDPLRHRCWRGDTEIALTAREMEVLAFFLSRAGWVLSKTEILSNVWDFDFEGDPNIVEVYVWHLRRKIDEPFGCKSIETIRGAGYRFDPDGG